LRLCESAGQVKHTVTWGDESLPPGPAAASQPPMLATSAGLQLGEVFLGFGLSAVRFCGEPGPEGTPLHGEVVLGAQVLPKLWDNLRAHLFVIAEVGASLTTCRAGRPRR
jgi:hypothetical protein